MANVTDRSNDNLDKTKRETVGRWLRGLEASKTPEDQAPFKDRGEPLYCTPTAFKRPQFFTYDELTNHGENNRAEVVESLKIPQPTHDRPPSSRERSQDIFVAIDSRGRKLMATEERFIQLGKGEKINPRGKTSGSTSRTNTPRTRALSRSNAVRRPSSTFAGEKEAPEKFRQGVFQTSNGSQLMPPRQARPATGDRMGSTSAILLDSISDTASSVGLYPGSASCTGTPRTSRFTERL